MIKEDTHIFQGMKRDNHPIRLDGKFLWDAHNIRFTNREDGALMSITNEKGTSLVLNEGLNGIYLGHCTVGDYLVVFTTLLVTILGKPSVIDRIYRYNVKNKELLCLYSGNLNFSLEYPIQAMGVYEGDFVLKVYWIDGLNQLRLINITAPELLNISLDDTTSEGKNPVYTHPSVFDAIPELKLNERVTIQPSYGVGLFAPGTILYAFTYYTKYGAQSNIFYVSQLHYISHSNRGATAEEVITDLVFNIEITNLDSKFDYVRVYSIHRTSLDGTPTVKLVREVPIDHEDNSSIAIQDTGLTGELVDPTQLLYFNSDKIIAKTFTSKDGTLFLGNLEVQSSDDYEYLVKLLNPTDGTKPFSVTTLKSRIPKLKGKVTNYSDIDSTSNIVTEYNISSLVPGQTYRLGVQVQNSLGVWSSPIWIEDYTVSTDQYPSFQDLLEVIKVLMTFNNSSVPEELISKGYKKIRGMIVYPSAQTRNVLYQGILCPTVFEINNRADNAPFAQSSWFFRPRNSVEFQINRSTQYKDVGVLAPFHSYEEIQNGGLYSAEVQSLAKTFLTDITDVGGAREANPMFFVDSSIFTFHSPDLELDYDNSPILDEDTSNIGLRIIGLVPFSYTTSGLHIETSSASAGSDSLGAINESSIHFLNGKQWLSSLSYNSRPIDDGKDSGDLYPVEEDHYWHPIKGGLGTNEYPRVVDWLVYPWSRTGALNNDIVRPAGKGTTTAVLKHKTLYNCLYSEDTTYFGSKWEVKKDSTNSQVDLYSVNQTYTRLRHSYGNIHSHFSYYGNVDLIFNLKNEYSLFFSYPNKGQNNDPFYKECKYSSSVKPSAIADGSDLISFSYSPFTYDWIGDHYSRLKTAAGASRIQYQSTPHIVGILSGNDSTNVILPYLEGEITDTAYANGYPRFNYTSKPFWLKEKKSVIDSSLRINSNNSPIIVFREDFYNNMPEGTNRTRYTLDYLAEHGGAAIVAFAPSGDSLGSMYCFMVRPYADGGDDFELWKTDEDWKNYSLGGITFSWKFIGSEKYIKYFNSYRYLVYNGTSSLSENRVRQIFNEKLTTNHFIDKRRVKAHLVNFVSEGGEVSTEYNHITIKLDTVPATGNPIFKLYEDSSLPGYDEYIHQDKITGVEPPTEGYLFLGEIYRTELTQLFQPLGKNNVSDELWLPAGLAVSLSASFLVVPFSRGDSFYQRYECLKTYGDYLNLENSIISIASFMCQTYCNIDKRTDRNRVTKKSPNFNITPLNFNLFNEVYNQKDNFFSYRNSAESIKTSSNNPTLITWSLEKLNMAEVDQWTNITLANTLNLDGNNGAITSLNVFNENLICFLEKAINKIQFNNRVQIPTSDGVPIEISNGYKVDGSITLSQSIGCQNKWSIVTTPLGMYFIDGFSNNMYLYNGQITNLTQLLGMSEWLSSLKTSTPWSYTEPRTIRSYYDLLRGDVYFCPTDEEALCYSELLQSFTSFVNYTNAALFNLNQGFYSLYRDKNLDLSLWQNLTGDYNHFYDKPYPYSLTFISNDNSLYTKVFDTLELRTDYYEPDTPHPLASVFPFDYIQAENEYQNSGKVLLSESKGDIKKKFRIWRANLPRVSDTAQGPRANYARARLRNPWVKITLENKDPGDNKMILHDLTVKYTI